MTQQGPNHWRLNSHAPDGMPPTESRQPSQSRTSNPKPSMLKAGSFTRLGSGRQVSRLAPNECYAMAWESPPIPSLPGKNKE